SYHWAEPTLTTTKKVNSFSAGELPREKMSRGGNEEGARGTQDELPTRTKRIVSASGGAPARPKRPAFFCDSSSLVYFLIFVIGLVAAVLIPLYANWRAAMSSWIR